MVNGLWGRKIGMTQVFAENYKVVPVTAIDVANWFITQVKTKERDGYSAVQLGCVKDKFAGQPFSSEWLKSPNKHFAVFKEVSLQDSSDSLVVGQQADLGALLTAGENVDVFGITIGHGFQGGVKRHGFAGGPGSHGGKLGRGPGSIGNMRSRGRVIKGQRMAGHMGVEQRVMKNLEIIKVETAAQVVLIKGSVPGKSGSLVFVRKRK